MSITGSISQTYDTYWMQSLYISAPAITGQATVTAQLVPYNLATGNTAQNMNVNLYLNDVLTKSASDPILANAINVIFTEIQRQCSLQGLI